MSYVYAVLGSGRQGTAAAYDMAKFGDAKNVLVADMDLEAARKSAARINKLIGKDIAIAHQVDVTNTAQLKAFLRPGRFISIGGTLLEQPRDNPGGYRSQSEYDRSRR